MGKIKKVLYEALPRDTYSEYDAGLNYFYQNAIGINDEIDNDFAKYEESQIKMRNMVISGAVSEGIHPNVRSTMIGLSSLANKAILISEV